MASPEKTRRKGRSRVLLRGEAFVASSGLALAAILLFGLAGAAWWSMRAQKTALELERQTQVRAVATGLADSIGGLLGAGELSAARRILMESARVFSLETCELVLADGSIVASADPPASFDVRTVPERLPSLPADAPYERVTSETISIGIPVHVGEQGSALLEVSSKHASSMSSLWRAQAGVGVVGALALAGLLLVYRRMRLRLRAMSAIRESLIAMERGQSAIGVLRVSPKLGSEAGAWNKLLGSLQELRQQGLVDKARGTGSGDRRGSSDLASACDAMWQGLVMVDDHLRIKYANGAAAVYLGVKREECVGAKFDALVDDEGLRERVRAVATGETRHRETLELRREGESGPSVLRFSVRPVRREDTASAVVLIEDVTQQRIADESRNAFVAQATHELRTPLTNIRLYVEEAVDSGDDDPAIRAKCLNVINLESRRLERIVADMLSVSEIEAGSLSLKAGDVRLDQMLDDLKADYDAQATDKNISLDFELPPKLPVIQADRDKLLLALHNLVGNALKYTPDSGRVTVKVEADNDQLVIGVSDTGIGIDEDDAEHVFDKFYRAKDKRIENVTGTGLGLALAREVIRLHGGDIELESELNKGSTFTLKLPTEMREAA